MGKCPTWMRGKRVKRKGFLCGDVGIDLCEWLSQLYDYTDFSF